MRVFWYTLNPVRAMPKRKPMALREFWGWLMKSKFHICATWQFVEKHDQELGPVWGLASFFMSCKKGPPTSWQKSISSLVCSHVDLLTVLTDGCCLHGKPPVLTCNGLLRGGY